MLMNYRHAYVRCVGCKVSVSYNANSASLAPSYCKDCARVLQIRAEYGDGEHADQLIVQEHGVDVLVREKAIKAEYERRENLTISQVIEEMGDW